MGTVHVVEATTQDSGLETRGSNNANPVFYRGPAGERSFQEHGHSRTRPVSIKEDCRSVRVTSGGSRHGSLQSIVSETQAFCKTEAISRNTVSGSRHTDSKGPATQVRILDNVGDSVEAFRIGKATRETSPQLGVSTPSREAALGCSVQGAQGRRIRGRDVHTPRSLADRAPNAQASSQGQMGILDTILRTDEADEGGVGNFGSAIFQARRCQSRTETGRHATPTTSLTEAQGRKSRFATKHENVSGPHLTGGNESGVGTHKAALKVAGFFNLPNSAFDMYSPPLTVMDCVDPVVRVPYSWLDGLSLDYVKTQGAPTRGSLMAITDTVIDMQRIISDMHLKGQDSSLLKLLSQESLFRCRFARPPEHNQPITKLSRDMLRHKRALFRGLLAIPDEDPVITMSLFTVAKKDGTERPVQDGRPLNERMEKPPKAEIPFLTKVRDDILDAKFVGRCDARGYFYQFPLGKRIRKYFGVKLCGMRGATVTGVMARMPMGWSFAPAVAQHVSNFLMEGLGVAYVDNFFILADTLQEFVARKKLFKQRIGRYRIVVDDGLADMSETFGALGMEFSKGKGEESHFRLDPKAASTMSEYHESLATFKQQEWSVGKFLSMLGYLIWACYITSTRLCNIAEVIDMVRRMWASGLNLSSPDTLAKETCQWSDEEKQVAQTWLSVFGANDWRKGPKKQHDTVTSWSDATPTTGAFMIFNSEDKMESAEQWSSEETPIFLAELDAFIRSMEECIRLGHSNITAMIDNLGLVRVINRGLSRVPEANAKLAPILNKINVRAEWVASEKMLVDSFTRGCSISEVEDKTLQGTEQHHAAWKIKVGSCVETTRENPSCIPPILPCSSYEH
jgi:hypothetical protein